MKKIRIPFLLMFFLLLFQKGYSQVDVVGGRTIVTKEIQSDPFNTSPNKNFEKRIKLKPIDESNNETEIRFYKLESLSNTTELKVIELNNGIWTASLYDEVNYPRIKIKKYKLEADMGFTELFQKLLNSNLTNLPSQDELEPKMKKYTFVNGRQREERIYTTDGQSYTIEFKIGDKFRIYTFHSPETYSSFYSDVQELKDYVAIKDIFETELVKK